MATTIEELDKWMNVTSEDKNLEFKSATASGGIHSERVFKYCVALSNEGGGKLILGVSNDPPRKVLGTNAASDPAGMQKKILDTLHFLVRVEELKHPDGRVVIFHIPARDQGTARQYDGAYWMRSGEELKPMTPERLKEIFGEGELDWLEGHSRTGLNAEEVVELLDAQTFFTLLGMSYPSEREAVIGRFVSERLVDASESGLSIRRLGALLLAKRLEDFPELSRKAPRVVVYIGGSKIETKLDQLGTYQSRNERLASLMRRFGICEEKSSGIDKVVQAAEMYQLPAPDFRAGFHRTQAIIYGPKAFEDMDRKDRIRACYQHCALKCVMGAHDKSKST